MSEVKVIGIGNDHAAVDLKNERGRGCCQAQEGNLPLY